MCKVYLWGDSIGKGVIFDDLRNRYCLCPTRATNLLINLGIDMDVHARMGATIQEGFADFSEIIPERNSVGIIEFGGNDCDLNWKDVAANPSAFYEGKTSLRDFQATVDQFIAKMRANHMRPVLVTPPPLVSDRFFRWVTRNLDADAILSYLGDIDHIYRWQERYSMAILDAARKNHCDLVNLRQAFLDAKDFPSLMCSDGMHPNADGQALIASILLPELSAIQLSAGA